MDFNNLLGSPLFIVTSGMLLHGMTRVAYLESPLSISIYISSCDPSPHIQTKLMQLNESDSFARLEQKWFSLWVKWWESSGQERECEREIISWEEEEHHVVIKVKWRGVLGALLRTWGSSLSFRSMAMITGGPFLNLLVIKLYLSLSLSLSCTNTFVLLN